MDERLDSNSYLYSDFYKISPLLSKLKFSITFMREKYVISKCWYLANPAGYEEMYLGTKLSGSWYIHAFSICNPMLCVLKNKKSNLFISQKRLLLRRISNGCYFFSRGFWTSERVTCQHVYIFDPRSLSSIYTNASIIYMYTYVHIRMYTSAYTAWKHTVQINVWES